MELSSVLAQIDSLKQEADSLLPVKPEFERVFWEKFRLEFNYNSNHMEGNTLTYGQTKLLLLFDRTTGDNKGREIEEMKAHDVALKMITDISSDPETALTEKLIREINEIILVRPFYNNAITPDRQPTKKLITPGAYKKEPNHVLLPDGSMFYYASPEETPALMGDLIEWYNQSKKTIHPVRLAALMHYKLVRIHPFDDSNGRTTRLIMNFILMQNGYAPLVIESKKKDDYLAALNKADVGSIDSFEEYIAEVSVRWQGLYLKALKGEKIEEAGDFDKEVELLKRDLSKPEEVEIKKSKAIVEQILFSSIYPLLEKIHEYLKKLDPFFFENKIMSSGNNFNLTFYDIVKIKSHHQRVVSLLMGTSQFGVNFLHTGLIKSGKREFGYSTRVSIICKDYHYRIEINDEKAPTIKKKYNQQITLEEMEIVADELAKKEFTEIKKQIEASK